MNQTLYEDVKKCMNKWSSYPDVYDSSDPQNRTALIEKNLRMAIDIALRYRGRGLSEDELISSAFLGLSNAYDKYKEDNPNNIRNRLLNNITESTTYDEFYELIQTTVSYGKILKALSKAKLSNYKDMQEFINKHIKCAKFSSVAYFWIIAQITSDIKKQTRSNAANLNECDRDRITTSIEDECYYEQLYDGISTQDEDMLNLRNGIGCDSKMTYAEIASLYDMSVQDVKEHISRTVEHIRLNIEKHSLDISLFIDR